MSSCGLGGWGGPLPGDPSNDVVLSAIGTYGGINVSWTFPTTNPYAVSYVKVFRGLTSNSANAIQIAEVGGDRFFDELDTVTTYYYWIQLISINGTVLALIGPESATSQLTVDRILEELSGRIDAGLLATILRTKIDKIDIVDLGLEQEILDRLADNAGFQSVLDALAGDFDGVATAIVNETATRVTQNSALVTSVNGLAVTVAGNTAAIINEATVRADEDSALTTRIDALYAVGGGDIDWVAAVLAEQTARVTQDGILAASITTVQTTLDDDIASVRTDLTADIDVVDGKVVAIGARYTAVVDVNGLVGGFGVYNDGSTIEAGFNVDTFWVGRATDKIKPFIIDSGIVYIKEAVIPVLTTVKIDLAVGGYIRGGQTAFDTGTGFYQGWVSGVPVMSVGSTTKGFVWDGSVFTVRGDVIVTGNLQNGAVNDTKLGLSVFTASIPAGDLSTSVSSGYQTYGSRTVVVSGGVAPYTYFWIVSDSGYVYRSVGISGGTTTNTVSIAGSGDGVITSAVVTCLVKDANGRCTFASFQAEGTHASTGGGGTD